MSHPSDQPTGPKVTPAEMQNILAGILNTKTNGSIPLPLLAAAAMSLVLAADKHHRPITPVVTLAERFNPKPKEA